MSEQEDFKVEAEGTVTPPPETPETVESDEDEDGPDESNEEE